MKAWADSLLYVRRQRGQLLLTAEHRGAPAPEPLALVLVGDDDVHLELVSAADGDQDAQSADHDPLALDRAIVDVLATAGRTLSRADLRTQLRVRNERLGDALTRLAQLGSVQRFADRWGVPDSPQP